MTEITFKVPDISCGHCVHTIQTELMDLEGVKKVVASAESKQVTVSFEPPADTEKVKALLSEINYPAAD
jgi:copper chaperone CopZ